MNKTKIEWTDSTLNPIVGCLNNCSYCYSRKQACRGLHGCNLCRQFIPHPHLGRLDSLSPRQAPRKVFIDSMWDWNEAGIRENWLWAIIRKMEQCPQHTFQILSKLPKGYGRFQFSHNVWLGTSITTTADCHRVRDLINFNTDNVKFASIEPIHGKIDFRFLREEIDWIIVGAETGSRRGKIKPNPAWISSIIHDARTQKIPLFIKNNVQWPEIIQEFPVVQW